MPAIVGEEHRVIRRYVDAVRPRVLARKWKLARIIGAL
jgi:hypothetical protein